MHRRCCFYHQIWGLITWIDISIFSTDVHQTIPYKVTDTTKGIRQVRHRFVEFISFSWSTISVFLCQIDFNILLCNKVVHLILEKTADNHDVLFNTAVYCKMCWKVRKLLEWDNLKSCSNMQFSESLDAKRLFLLYQHLYEKYIFKFSIME